MWPKRLQFRSRNCSKSWIWWRRPDEISADPLKVWYKFHQGWLEKVRINQPSWAPHSTYTLKKRPSQAHIFCHFPDRHNPPFSVLYRLPAFIRFLHNTLLTLSNVVCLVDKLRFTPVQQQLKNNAAEALTNAARCMWKVALLAASQTSLNPARRSDLLPL